MNTNETIYRAFIRVIQKLGLNDPRTDGYYQKICGLDPSSILSEMGKLVESIRCAQKKQDKAEVVREVAKLWLCTLVLLVLCSPPSDYTERVRQMLPLLPEAEPEEGGGNTPNIRAELVRLVKKNLDDNHENEVVDLLWLLSLLLLVSFGLDVRDILMQLITQREVARNERER